MPFISSTDSRYTENSSLSSRPHAVSFQADDAYLLQYHDSDQREQHITCKTMYDALIWAREEAHEHASNVRIYKLCHTELAP